MGLSAVMAARVAGAATIIAVDVVPSRLELALELGATHAIDGSETDAVAEIHRIAPGGADFALDTTGLPALIQRASTRCGSGAPRPSWAPPTRMT